MNRHVYFNKGLVAAWLSALLAAGSSVAAAPVAQAVAPEVMARSVFVLPTNQKEGRDPFFPTSTRVYETVAAARPQIGDVSSLVLRGISGPPNNRLAIINNHTVGVGDEEDMVTSQGRIHFRCVEIKENSVVIETGGQRHKLTYTNSH